MRCPNCGTGMSMVGGGMMFCQSCGAKKPYEPTRAPIYPVEVIEVACRALEALAASDDTICAGTTVPGGSALIDVAGDVMATSLRIIRDGLASHEKAIKGES